MYLRTLRVAGIKLLRDLTLDFTRDGEPRMWTVILGPNGLCKTTLLQVAGLLASGATFANRLANVPSMPDRRPDAPDLVGASALFDLDESAPLSPAPARLGVTQTIARGEKIIRGESIETTEDEPPPVGLWSEGTGAGGPIEDIRSKDLPGWMAAGYGTVRVLPTPRSASRPNIRCVERVQTLFDEGTLVGTGFPEVLPDPDAYVAVLREALLESGVLPNVRDLELRAEGEVSERHQFHLRVGADSVALPATWLSQGYQATIAWIADLIGQFFLDAGEPVALADMRGLVLIDELDLHLHPRWQVSLVPAIRQVFPNVQFVATTHSPMVLPGLDRDEVFVLSQDQDGHVVAEHPEVTPKLMTGSEIYRVFFGIEALYPNDLAEKLRRYSFLVGDPGRSDGDEQEMLAIRDELREAGVDPGWEPVPRQPPDPDEMEEAFEA